VLNTLANTVLQPFVKVVDRTGRHFSNGELAKILVDSILKLRLGANRPCHFEVCTQQLLLQQIHTGVDSGTKFLFSNIGKALDLVVGTCEASSNRGRKNLRVTWSNEEERHKQSSGSPYSQCVILKNHFKLVGPLSRSHKPKMIQMSKHAME
jgi:hypothetical protein